MVKNLLAKADVTWVRSLDQEDPLEEGMATHSSIPAWRIPWTEEPGGLQSMRSQKIGHYSVTHNCEKRVSLESEEGLKEEMVLLIKPCSTMCSFK